MQLTTPLPLHSLQREEPMALETKIRSAATTTITPMMMPYCWALLGCAGGGGGAISPSSAPQLLHAASCFPTLASHSGHLGMGSLLCYRLAARPDFRNPGPAPGPLFWIRLKQLPRGHHRHLRLVGFVAQMVQLHDLLGREVGARQ